MRQYWIMPALLLGAGLLTASAHAASTTAYQAGRAQAKITTLASNLPLTSQFGSHAGEVIEVDGTVSGIVSGSTPGFLLQTGGGQTLVISLEKADPDVAVGNHLRVLGKIPAYGVKLTAISLTRPDFAYPPEKVAAVAPSAPPAATTTPPAAPAGQVIQKPIDANPAKTDAAPANTANANPPAPKATNQAAAPKPPATSSVAAVLPTVAAAATPAKKNVPVAAKPSLEDTVNRYGAMIKLYNRSIQRSTAWKIAYAVVVKSSRYGVDPRLVLALIAQESRFNPRAVSPVGARGLGQLMPGTASRMGISDSFDIYENVEGTIRYLAEQLQRFNGNTSYALAAYNAGPGNVIRYGGIPPFRETKNYVRLINMRYNNMSVNSL